MSTNMYRIMYTENESCMTFALQEVAIAIKLLMMPLADTVAGGTKPKTVTILSQLSN